MQHLTMAELEAGLDEIARAPKDDGRLEMIVRRPRMNEREILEEGELSPDEGLIGDSWKNRKPNPDMQLNIMNSRAVSLVARNRDRWPLAGDQLFIDLDLSSANLPPGARLAIGSAIIEVTAVPHNGCGKFESRFGADAVRFVNSPRGKELHLRGLNARVVQGGRIRTGDRVIKFTV